MMMNLLLFTDQKKIAFKLSLLQIFDLKMFFNLLHIVFSVSFQLLLSTFHPDICLAVCMSVGLVVTMQWPMLQIALST